MHWWSSFYVIFIDWMYTRAKLKECIFRQKLNVYIRANVFYLKLPNFAFYKSWIKGLLVDRYINIWGFIFYLWKYREPIERSNLHCIFDLVAGFSDSKIYIAYTEILIFWLSKKWMWENKMIFMSKKIQIIILLTLILKFFNFI